MCRKLKLCLILEFFIVTTVALLELTVGAATPTEISYDISEAGDSSAKATLIQIGEDEYSLSVFGAGWVEEFDTAPWSAYSDKIKSFTVEKEVKNLPPAAFSGLTVLDSLTIKSKGVLLPSEITDLHPFTTLYIHESSTAKRLFQNHGKIVYICEFSSTVCVECGYECISHTGGVSTCASGAICDKCHFEYGERLTTHTGGTATCKERARCEVCNEYYGELLATHTGGTATCKERAKCEVCNEYYGDLLTTHTGGTATCKERARCEVCNEYYGELLATHTGGTGTATCKEKAKCKLCGEPYGELSTEHTGGNPTCEASAVCELCNTAYGAPTGHTLSFVPANAPTCEGFGTVAHYRCEVCNGNFDENKSELISIYIGATGHSGGKANCQSPALCEVCGVAYGAPDLSEHSFSSGFDLNEHFDVCPCGEKMNVSAHTFTSEITKPSTESECGTREYKCQCGYSYVEAIPKLEADNSQSNTNQNQGTNEEKEEKKEKEDNTVLWGVLFISLPLVSFSVVFSVISVLKRRKIKS